MFGSTREPGTWSQDHSLADDLTGRAGLAPLAVGNGVAVQVRVVEHRLDADALREL